MAKLGKKLRIPKRRPFDTESKPQPTIKVGNTEAHPDDPNFQDPALEALIARSNLR